MTNIKTYLCGWQRIPQPWGIFISGCIFKAIMRRWDLLFESEWPGGAGPASPLAHRIPPQESEQVGALSMVFSPLLQSFKGRKPLWWPLCYWLLGGRAVRAHLQTASKAETLFCYSKLIMLSPLNWGNRVAGVKGTSIYLELNLISAFWKRGSKLACQSKSIGTGAPPPRSLFACLRLYFIKRTHYQ